MLQEHTVAAPLAVNSIEPPLQIPSITWSLSLTALQEQQLTESHPACIQKATPPLLNLELQSSPTAYLRLSLPHLPRAGCSPPYHDL